MNHRFFTKILLTLGLLACAATAAYAVKAYPHPVTVKQPDGTTLTIQIHGDEFLNWTTVGNRLVAMGEDGYYYYASFNADGTKSLSTTRAKNSTVSLNGASTVKPPQAAIAAANIKRQVMAKIGNSDLAIGSNHFLVMLIEAQDVRFTVPDANAAFTRMLNEEGYSENGATGSAYDFYNSNSRDLFDPTFDVIGPITVNGNMSNYGDGGNNDRADYMLVEACQIADPDVDFAQYDHDGDGIIDNVFFFFAGHNAAEGGGSNTIWPHQWSVFRPSYGDLDGKKLGSYACTSEYSGASGQTMAGIGTFCHEFGHVIGLPDFYDTDYETNGYAPAIGTISLMDQGSYNNQGRTPPFISSFERSMLGWLELEEWTEPGVKTLPPVQENAGFMTPTSNDGEFFVYEYRNGEGYDQYIGATGVAIYHVDQSGSYKLRWDNNTVNAYANHQCYDLIESVYPESSAYSNNDKLFPGRSNNRTFNANSKPAAVGWDGLPTGYNISEITDNGDNATLLLSMMASGETIPEFVEAGINCIYQSQSSYKSGDTFSFLLCLSNNAPMAVVWYFDGQEQSEDSIVLTSGEHTVEAFLTYSDNATERITLLLNVQ